MRGKRKKRSLRDVFLAHKGNNHNPHALRKNAVIAALALALVIEVGYLSEAVSGTSRSMMATVFPATVATLTNERRASDNAAPLTVDPLLTAAAQAKANDMAARGYFSHNDPDGSPPWRWLEREGYKYQYAGENLAIDANDSEELVQAWMDSPAHRHNLLKKEFTRIGVGTATGMYDGHETTFVVQFFAKPLDETPVQKSVAIPKPVGQQVAATPASSTSVLGVETEAPSPVEKIASSPRTYATYALAALAVLFAFLLLLAVLPSPRFLPHPNALINGAALLAVIAGLMILNRSILAAPSVPNDAQSASVSLSL